MKTSSVMNALSRVVMVVLVAALAGIAGLLVAVSWVTREPAALMGLMAVVLFLLAINRQLRKVVASTIELVGRSFAVFREGRREVLDPAKVIWARLTEETLSPFLLLWCRRAGGQVDLVGGHFPKSAIPEIREAVAAVQERSLRALREGAALPVTSPSDVRRGRAVAALVGLLSIASAIGAFSSYRSHGSSPAVVVMAVLSTVLVMTGAFAAARLTTVEVRDGAVRRGRKQVACAVGRLKHVGWGFVLIWCGGDWVPWVIGAPDETLARAVIRTIRKQPR